MVDTKRKRAKMMNKEKVQIGITSLLLAGTVFLSAQNIGLQQDVNELEKKVAFQDEIEREEETFLSILMENDEFTRQKFDKGQALFKEARQDWTTYEEFEKEYDGRMKGGGHNE